MPVIFNNKCVYKCFRAAVFFCSPNGCEKQSGVLRGYCVGHCPVSQVGLLPTLITSQAIRCFYPHQNLLNEYNLDEVRL
jgi:hypothetical protein